MQAVILAGGMGTRLREETEFKPKPMVEIGGRPIIWHLMKNLSEQSISEFIICLGYKGDQIKDYFLNYNYRNNDFHLRINDRASSLMLLGGGLEEDWKVTLADTGIETMTGGRVKRIQKYLNPGTFLCTYGDGLADINIANLLDFHKNHKRLATVTAAQPTNRFGELKISNENLVNEFSEKPKSEKWVNGEFFLFEHDVLKLLDENSILEKEPLETLARKNELMAFKHSGFWQPMDTFRESTELNELWNKNLAPWKNWDL